MSLRAGGRAPVGYRASRKAKPADAGSGGTATLGYVTPTGRRCCLGLPALCAALSRAAMAGFHSHVPGRPWTALPLGYPPRLPDTTDGNGRVASVTARATAGRFPACLDLAWSG